MKFTPTPPEGFSRFTVVVIGLELIIAFSLLVAIISRTSSPIAAGASQGVPELISYQGMLLDSGGNPLGGTGTVYCFRYSIWDAEGGGNQLWPGGTPGNSTTTVTQGYFSDQLGRVDSLSALDFESTSTYYLQVQVSTSSPTCSSGLETLSPRQQITSDAWSQTAQTVYGDQLRVSASNNTVQVGTGAGVSPGTQTLLVLDTANAAESVGSSCTRNGTLWYNSGLQKVLMCENLIIREASAPSSSLSFNFFSPTTTTGYDFAAKYTTTQKGVVLVSCGEATAATSTLEVGYATTAANGLAGTIDQVVLSSIACGNGSNSVTTFTTSTIPGGSYLIVKILSTAGNPVHTTLSIAAIVE